MKLYVIKNRHVFAHYDTIMIKAAKIESISFDYIAGLTIIAPSASKTEAWAAEYYVNFQPAAETLKSIGETRCPFNCACHGGDAGV